MKSPLIFRSKGRSGFTLVEMLVVIGIIAILASVLFSVGSSAIRAAQRAKASQIANSIQTAALNYYTEYNTYPVPTGTAGDLTYGDNDFADWTILTEALCGNINPSNAQSVPATTITNSRNIAFLSMKASDLVTTNNSAAPKNPLPVNAANNTFNIVFDSDYDNIVGNGTVTGQPDGSTAGSPMPDFVNSAPGKIVALTNGASGGVAVWADCNTSTTSENPNFFVHTY